MGTTRLVNYNLSNPSFGQTIHYFISGSEDGVTGAESTVERTFRQSGTLANLFAKVITNSINGSSTLRLRKNRANFGTDISVSIGNSATGIFEDTTNSGTIAAADEADYQLVLGGTTGSMTIITLGCTFASDTDTYCYFASTTDNAVGFTDNTTRYTTFSGQMTNTSTETDCQLTMRTAGTLKHGFCLCSQNDISSASTVRTRKNAANGGITISITGNTTGIFEDTSGTDTVAANDKFAFQVVAPTVGGTHTISLNHVSVGFQTTTNNFELGSVSVLTSQGQNLTRYYPIGNVQLQRTTEDCDLTMRLSNLVAKEATVEVANNSFLTLASTVTLRQNATDAITISVPANSTGTFSQTGSVSYATTDETNYSVISPNESGSIAIQQLSSIWDVTPPTNVIISFRPPIYYQLIPYMTETYNRNYTNPKPKYFGSWSKLFTGTVQVVNETENSSELVNKILGFIKVVNETENIQESVNRLLGIIRIVNETENISELVNKLMGINRNVNETENIQESNNKLMAMVRNISETENIQEAVNKLMSIVRNVNETENIQELVNKILGIIKIVNETENISELLNKILGFIKVVNETENIQELTNKVLGIVRNVSETENTSELVNKLMSMVRVINETENISELINKLMAITRNINETDNIQELVNKLMAINRNINETENIQESTNKLLGIVRTLVEGVNISELSNKLLGIIKNVGESVNISELKNNVLATLTLLVKKTVKVFRESRIFNVLRTRKDSKININRKGADIRDG